MIRVWDIDILFGFWPGRRVDMTLRTVRELLGAAGVERGWACSVKGALHDAETGNQETVDALRDDAVLRPVGTIDLRDALACDDTLTRLAEHGVRTVRLFPHDQKVEPHYPGFRHIVRRIAEAGMVLMVGGDVRHLADVFRPIDVQVVFLDVHAYHVADFVLLCQDHPGCHASTRLLNGPGSIERVVSEVGSERLVYGSRIPLHYSAPSLRLLEDARLSAEDKHRIASGNLERMLGQS